MEMTEMPLADHVSGIAERFEPLGEQAVLVERQAEGRRAQDNVMLHTDAAGVPTRQQLASVHVRGGFEDRSLIGPFPKVPRKILSFISLSLSLSVCLSLCLSLSLSLSVSLSLSLSLSLSSLSRLF